MADDKKTNERQKRTLLAAMGDAYGRNEEQRADDTNALVTAKTVLSSFTSVS